MVNKRTFLFHISPGKKICISDNVYQDQTARSVQSDLDLRCPQKVSELRIAT